VKSPHWERGHRCYGYWLDGERIGFVSLPPSVFTAREYGYGWFLDYPTFNAQSGNRRSLRSAKRRVENAYLQALDMNAKQDMGRKPLTNSETA
jgi:hypothetical protein